LSGRASYRKTRVQERIKSQKIFSKEEIVMEMNLSGIIEKIKKEGVQKAEEEASAILSAAKEEKEKMLEKAKSEARQTIEKAQKDAEKIKQNAETSIRQAARDVILGLRGSIVSLFDSIVKRETGKALDQESIKKMIEALAVKFAAGENSEIEAVLSEKDKEDLSGFFEGKLGKEMASGITLSASREVEKGFRIGKKDSGVYYDFTDEAISEALSSYLNKNLLAILSSGKANE
jgi:V/A-type H+-transporting ATPase subunit E